MSVWSSKTYREDIARALCVMDLEDLKGKRILENDILMIIVDIDASIFL